MVKRVVTALSENCFDVAQRDLITYCNQTPSRNKDLENCISVVSQGLNQR